MPAQHPKARRRLRTAVGSCIPPKFDYRRAHPRVALHQVQVAGFAGAALGPHDGLDRRFVFGGPTLGDAAQRRIVRGHPGACEAEIPHGEPVPCAGLGIRAFVEQVGVGQLLQRAPRAAIAGGAAHAVFFALDEMRGGRVQRADAIVMRVAAQAAAQIVSSLILGKLVHRDYAKTAAQAGDAVNITPIANAPQPPPIVLKTEDATFQIPDVTKALDFPDLLKTHTQPAVSEIAGKIDTDIAALYSAAMSVSIFPAISETAGCVCVFKRSGKSSALVTSGIWKVASSVFSTMGGGWGAFAIGVMLTASPAWAAVFA